MLMIPRSGLFLLPWGLSNLNLDVARPTEFTGLNQSVSRALSAPGLDQMIVNCSAVFEAIEKEINPQVFICTHRRR